MEQIEVFNSLKNKDEMSISNTEVDLNNAIDIFHAIYSQVINTSQEYTFICILRYLLRLDNANKSNAVIWEIIEKLVCRATCLDTNENFSLNVAALERYAQEKFSIAALSTRESNNQQGSPSTSSLIDIKDKQREISSSSSSLPAPPPPPPAPPFPILPHIQLSQIGENTSLNNTFMTKLNEKNEEETLDLQINELTVKVKPITEDLNTNNIKLLPQQCIPKPNSKLKQLTWSKIPSNRVLGKDNLWTKFNTLDNFDKEHSNFFFEIEECFKINDNMTTGSLPTSHISSPVTTNEKEIKETRSHITLNHNYYHHFNASEINLLDSKRSLNINIYLKQFRCHPDEIIEYLQLNNQNNELGLENLEGMIKILPDANEIELLKSYQGELEKLAEAEKFLLKLIHVPNYKIRIDSLLLKEEFNSQTFYLKNSFENIFKAADAIYNSSNLASIMLYICKTGNFLNEGAYCGNAAGFKLSSLIKLTDLKSNKNNLTLLHVIINQLEKYNSKVLDTTKELYFILKDVINIQLDNFKNEVHSFSSRVNKLIQQTSKIDGLQINSLKEFLKMALSGMSVLVKKESDLESWKHTLADYFCEDPATFKLEECFNILFKFCEKIKMIIHENQEKRLTNEARRTSNIRNSKGSFLNGSIIDINILQQNKDSIANEQIHSTQILNNFNQNQFRRNSSLTSSTNSSSTKVKYSLNKFNTDKETNSIELSSYPQVRDKDHQTEEETDRYEQVKYADDLKFIDGTLNFVNESSSNFRRAGFRLSRKTNSTTTHRSSASPNLRANFPDSINLFEFLNNGIETSNRELINTSLSMKSFESETPSKKEQEEEKQNDLPIKKVKLRRSSSTNEIDTSLKINYRRGITSAVLEETCCGDETTFAPNSDHKASNRLSCLKKLGDFQKLASMYKTFQDDDIEMSKTRTNRQSNIKYLDDTKNISNSEETKESENKKTFTNRSSNLEAKLAFFENKNLNIINNKQKEDHVKLEDNSPFSRASKLRHTSQSNASTCHNTKSKIVSDCIMKFENKADEPKKDSNDPSTSTQPLEFNIKCANSVKLTETIEEYEKNPVKLLSKNWEILSGSNKLLQTQQILFNSTNNNARKNVSNNEIKFRTNSDSNTSDDCEVSTSKDDGFETQSNASSSQINDQNLKDTIESNLNQFLNNITNHKGLSSCENLTKPIVDIINETSTVKINENQQENINKNSAKKKQAIVTITASNKPNNRSLSTITTSFSNNKKSITQSSALSITNKTSNTLNQNYPVINLKMNQNNHNHPLHNSSQSLNESHRKKSGSSSGLYLCDTVSTKAKRYSFVNNYNINQQTANTTGFKITTNNSQLQLTSSSNQISNVKKKNSIKNSNNNSINNNNNNPNSNIYNKKISNNLSNLSFQSNSSNDLNSTSPSGTNQNLNSSSFLLTSFSIPTKINGQLNIDIDSTIRNNRNLSNSKSMSVFDRLAKNIKKN